MTETAIDNLEDIARELVRKPFRHLGRGPDDYDCLGLILYVQRRRGHDVGDPVPTYDRDPGPAFLDNWASFWEATRTPQPGDVVMVRRLHPTLPDHVGILLSGRRMLHASQNGVVIERLDGYETKKRIHGYFRPKLGGELSHVQSVPCVGHVRVTFRVGPFGEHRQWLEAGGKTAREYIPAEVDAEALHVWHQTQRIGLDDIVMGGELYVYSTVGIPAAVFGTTVVNGVAVATTAAIVAATAVNIAIGTLLSLLASLLSQQEAPTLGVDDPRPSFGLSGARHTVGNGETVPIVYGTHQVAGQIIGLFYRANTNFESTLYMLIAVSEGEVQSIGGYTTDQTDLPASAFAGRDMTINGNPISGFPGVTVSLRLGSLTQALIPGFEDTTTANNVDITLENDGTTTTAAIVAENAETYVYTTTDEIDAFEANIRFPTGLYSVNGDGDVQSYPLYFTLRYRLVGATTDTVEFVSIFGTYRGDHTRTLRREMPTRGQYRISFTRSIINDEDTERRFSLSIISTINEIVYDEAANYGGRAVIGVKTIASNQISGQIPTVTSLVEGKKVYTWDGVSLASPTLTYTWSDNPAWVALDVLTSKRYGLGTFIRLNDIDLQRFKDWADECDEVITTDGTMHARYSFNYVFDQASRAFDSLAAIANAGRATIIYSGRKLSVRMERASTPVQMFGMGNIIAGSMTMTYLDRSRRPNFVELEFVDETLDYDRNIAQIESATGTDEDIRKETTRLVGITLPQQAYRAVQYQLNLSNLITKTLRFDAPIDAITMEAGDTFYWAHDVPQIGQSGRVVFDISIDTEGIVIDRDITIATGDKITLRLNDGTLVTRTLTAGTYTAGEKIEPTTAWDVGEFPEKYNPYSIGPDSSRLSEWRCISKSLLPNFTTRIEAVNYDADIYDDDPGEIPESTDTYPDSRRMLDNPTNVTALDTVVTKKDGGSSHVIDVSWTAEVHGVDHDVWWRYDDVTDPNDDPIPSTWRFAGTTRDSSLVVNVGQTYGKAIEVSVCPRNAGQTATAPDYGARVFCAILGKYDEPADVTGLSVEQIDGRVVLRWSPVDDYDLDHYEIRASATDEDWAFAQVLEKHARGCQAIVWPPLYGSAIYLLIKAVNRSGVSSRLPAAIAVTPRIGASKILNSDVITASDWTASGTSDTNFTLTGSTFQSDAAATTATWTSDEDGYPLLSRRGRVHAFLDVTAWDFTTTYDAAGYPWSPRRSERFESDGRLLDIPDPEYRIREDDATFAEDSPTAATTSFPRYDWAENWSVVLEYRMSTDSTPSTWDSWQVYTGPVEYQDRFYIQFRVTYTDAAGVYQVDLNSLTITTTLPEEYDVIDDLNIQDHFATFNSETGEYGILGWSVSGTGATGADYTKSPENHPGVVQISTSATTGNYAALHLGTTGVKFIPEVFTYHRYQFIFETDESADHTIYVGLANGVSTTTPSRFVWCTAVTGGNFDVSNKNGSGTTTTNTTIGLNASSWYRFTIEFIGESAIKFTLETSVKSESFTHTATIPTDTAMTAMFKITNSANSAKALNCDAFRARIVGLQELI